SPGTVVVPLLRHVGSRGNTTVFEWRTGQEPRRVERPQLQEEPEPPGEDTVSAGPQRDPRVPCWVFSGLRGVWGPSPRRLTGGTSPWGPLRVGRGLPPWPPSHPAVPEGVACGSDALTLLENPETRNQFIDELMELELFLAQRLAEMEEEADIVAMSQLQLAPALLQGQTSAHVASQLGTVRALLAQLCSRSVQHLCMILAPRP
ncbi:CK5P3 protein, partial [Xiphorhynchus elegans]|nr:CK5P3 protein [Xiphorhynchus elegans]